MATKLTASAVATFNNGASYSDDSPVVGYRSAGVPRVIRYTFTTPSSGASSYSVMISGCSKLDGDCTQLKCYLTTSTNSHSVATSAYSSDGVLTRRTTTTGYGQYEFYSGTITKSLAGNTTYYLWVFAASETKPLSVFLPKTGYQYQTNLATITVNEGSGSSTTTGTTVSTSDITFTKSAYTDNNHPYTLIARVREASSTSSSVTFNLKVTITSPTSGAGYEYRYGNKLDIKVNNSSLYYSDNMTNGSYILDINYGAETALWEGTFTLSRGTNGKAAGVIYVNFCQTQLSNFNPIIQENILSTQPSGYVSTAPTAKILSYNGSAQALVNAGSGTGTMYYRLGTSGSFSTSIPTATNAGTYSVYYYSAATGYYTQSATGGPVNITISPIPGWVTLSSSSGSTTVGTNKTVTVSSHHGGTLSVSSSNTGVATVSISGTTITISPVAGAGGTATITVASATTTNYTRATASYTITVIGGLVYIDNGSGLEAYQVYIDNGSSWDLYIPYIDNGSGWDQCG